MNVREEVEHWEADLMSFRANTQHLLVIHERVTRYTTTIKLENKIAAITLSALVAFFESLPKELLKSVTFDNGMEFALHNELAKMLGIPTYFCDVYASWQKEGIENMNGRLRRDLPRKTDLWNMPENDLEQIVLAHNLMPRKVLGRLSPIVVLAKHMDRAIVFIFNQGVALHS